MEKIKFKSIIIVLFFLLSMFQCLFNLSFFTFYDEIIAIFAFFYIVFSIKTILYSKIRNFFIIIIFLCLLGIFSNLIFNVSNLSFSDIFFDLFMFLKPYLIIIASLIYFSNNSIDFFTRKSINLISKTVVLILFAGLLLYFIGIENLKDSSGNYVFFGSFTGDIANCLIVCLIIIFLDKKNSKYLYLFFSLFIIIFVNSGLGLLGLILVFYFGFVSKKFKIRWYYYIFLFFIVLIVSLSEIKTYFFDENAPRFLMFKYSFVTANNYFPFGSGFGTYGSVVSVSKYSSLYYEYGFSTMWGMSPNSERIFLYDTYYPMIIGQFGYFGLLLYLISFISIYRKLLYKNRELYRMSIVSLLYLAAMGLGFNTASLTGCMLFFVFSYSFIFEERKIGEVVNEESFNCISIGRVYK